MWRFENRFGVKREKQSIKLFKLVFIYLFIYLFSKADKNKDVIEVQIYSTAKETRIFTFSVYLIKSNNILHFT